MLRVDLAGDDGFLKVGILRARNAVISSAAIDLRATAPLASVDKMKPIGLVSFGGGTEYLPSKAGHGSALNACFDGVWTSLG